MEYRDFERDFIRRTLENLRFVEAAAHERPIGEAAEAGPYEVTQLVNSLLGLIVMPHELMRDRVRESPPTDLADWPLGVECWNGHPRTRSLSEYLRHLRNGVAHLRVDFLHEGGQISGITVKDRNREGMCFAATLSVAELRDLVRRLGNHLLALPRDKAAGDVEGSS